MGIVRYADFRISRKLLCLLTLVAIPFGLMTWSYVDQARKDISFASRELDGVRYLQSLTPLLLDLSRISTGLPPETIAALEPIRARHDGVFNSTEAVESFLRAASRPDPVAAMTQAQAALVKIADGSNLTLDPKLDSYYLMYLVSVVLPESATATAALRRALEPFRSGFGTRGDLAILLSAASRFERVRDAVQNAVASAIEGNAAGRVLAELGEAPMSLLQTSHTVSTAISHIAMEPDSAPLVRLVTEAERAIERQFELSSALSRVAETSLAGLLGDRIALHQREMRTNLSLQLGFFVAIILFTIAAARSIARPLVALSGEVSRVSAGQRQTVISGCDRSDEIGDIARAIEDFAASSLRPTRPGRRWPRSRSATRWSADGCSRTWQGASKPRRVISWPALRRPRCSWKRRPTTSPPPPAEPRTAPNSSVSRRGRPRPTSPRWPWPPRRFQSPSARSAVSSTIRAASRAMRWTMRG